MLEDVDSFSSKHLDDFYFEEIDEGSAQSASQPQRNHSQNPVKKLKSQKTPEKKNSVLVMVKNEL